MGKYILSKRIRRMGQRSCKAGLLLAGVCLMTHCQPSGTDELLSLGGSSTQVCTEPTVCGQNSGLVPFHKDAVHAALLWTKKSECPNMMIWMRPGEYKPRHYLNPTVNGVFSGFDPEYLSLVQGGFALSQLDRSGWSRYAPDLDRENTQLIDVCKLQDLIDRGAFTKSEMADLTDEDMRLTDPFFRNAGFSRGLGQNLFCAGHVAGIDGRLYVIGGHDKAGNNGIRKISIFDPRNEQWVRRPMPCVRSQFETDPSGTAFAHCSALNEDNTDPPAPSDMKYQRWYPTGVTLPDGKILILSGSDQDTSVGPQQAGATKVRQAVPEVYDPVTDKNIALENARRLMPMYPRSFIVQTGRGRNDWKVCAVSEAVPPFPGEPGGAAITGYDPFVYQGNTACLDVQAALSDPARNVPASRHWQVVDTAANAHDSGAGVQLVTVHADGTWSQKVFLFGGDNGNGADSSEVAEFIDFSRPAPRWQRITDLLVPTVQNSAAVLPDGKILVIGGRDSMQYQMFDPADGSRQALISSSVPRHDHATLLVTPSGGAWVMGGNRVNLLPANENQAVPVLEFYKPPYLFKGPRPVILKGPEKITYGQNFKLDVSGDLGSGSVALLRTGPTTHNWSWGNSYVRLPFVKEGNGKLRVTAPPLPGLAVAGDYLLFVVSNRGVPSQGKHVRLELVLD